MKGFDFTQTGGFPLTQDVLGYLQDGYTEAIKALAAIGGNIAGPMVISGMEVTAPSPGAVAVANGWFMYNGDLIQFTGGTVTPTGGDVALALIAVSETPLVFFDGLSHDVKLNKTATLIAAPTATDATHFPISLLSPFGRERDWTEVTLTSVGIPQVSGSIFYKKDYITNTLLIRGDLTADNAVFVTPLPTPVYYMATTLPIGYRPSNDFYFIAVNSSPVLWHTLDNDDWLRHINCKIETNGSVRIEWLPNSGAASGYSIKFNARASLD